MHHSKTYETADKPEIILYYNMTKGGVDAFDKKCAKNSSSVVPRDGPLQYSIDCLILVVSMLMRSTKHILR